MVFSIVTPEYMLTLSKDTEPEVEVFKGWKGMRSAYKMMLENLQPGDTNIVIGATSGEDKEAATRFFQKIHNERREKRIKLKMILNQVDKKWD